MKQLFTAKWSLAPVAAGVVMCFFIFGLLFRIATHLSYSESLVIKLGNIAVALVAGGLFAAAVAREQKLGHALMAGVWVGTVLIVMRAFVNMSDVHIAVKDEQWRDLEPWRGSLDAIGLLIIISFSIGFPLLGAIIERVATNWSRRLHPPHEWIYITADGKKIPARGPQQEIEIALLLRIVGVMLFATAWVPMMTVANALLALEMKALRSVNITFFLSLFVDIVPPTAAWVGLAFACVRVAGRRTARSVDECLKRDARPPIVFLRSFLADGRDMTGKLWHDYSAGLYAAPPQSSEMHLASQVGWTGPMVAIGRPGEFLPELGASRMYVSHEDWRTVVMDLSRKSVAVILQAGETEGLRWELQMVVESLRSEQVLLFLPFALTEKAAAAKKSYARFRAWAGPCFPGDLPIAIGNGCFIYFSGPTWTPSLLSAGTRAPRNHALASLLDDLATNSHFHKQPPTLLAFILGCVVIAAAYYGQTHSDGFGGLFIAALILGVTVSGVASYYLARESFFSEKE